MATPPRLLFVCLGNICRSPAAEGVARARLAAAGIAAVLDSAGTGGWHAGEPPHPPMVAAARARGYDLSGQRARQVDRADFTRFDRIFAMDRRNLADLGRVDPGQGARPELFLGLVPGLGRHDVPDPWYTGDFDETLDLVEAAVAALVAQLGPGQTVSR